MALAPRKSKSLERKVTAEAYAIAGIGKKIRPSALKIQYRQ